MIPAICAAAQLQKIRIALANAFDFRKRQPRVLRTPLTPGATTMQPVTTRRRECATSVDGVTFTIAESLDSQFECLSLVHERYVASGLMQPNQYGVRVLPEHCEPFSVILMAYDEYGIICTSTLILDGPRGLPIEELYPDEIQQRRGAGLKLAEVSCLAGQTSADPLAKRSRPPIGRMMTFLGGLAQFLQVDRLVIAVHPRHSRFYRRKFGFEAFGEEKSYGKVQDRPAVPCEIVDIPTTLQGLLDKDTEFQLPQWRKPNPTRIQYDMLSFDVDERLIFA